MTGASGPRAAVAVGRRVSRLPAQYYAVGSAVNLAIRQIGSVIGVAIIVLRRGHASV